MKKFFVYAILCLSFTQLRAQKAIIFKIKYTPGYKYVANDRMKMTIHANLSGDQEMLDKLATQGITQPITFNVNVSSGYAINTGQLSADKSFPIIFNNISNEISGTMNGQGLPIPAMPERGKIYGRWLPENKLTIDSIGKKAVSDSSTQKMTAQLLSSIVSQVKFPDKALKIGDTFIQDIPLSLPVAGNNLTLNIKITYKLVSIADGRASFDITQTMDMDIAIKQSKIKVTANGSGTMIYSIKNNFPEAMKTSLDMKFNGLLDKVTIDGTAAITADNAYTFN